MYQQITEVVELILGGVAHNAIELSKYDADIVAKAMEVARDEVEGMEVLA